MPLLGKEVGNDPDDARAGGNLHSRRMRAPSPGASSSAGSTALGMTEMLASAMPHPASRRFTARLSTM